MFPTSAAVGGAASVASDLQALLDDAADGRLERFDLFDAALIAGGKVEARHRAAYREQLERLVAELQVSGRVVGSDFDKARAVHQFLHARVLRSFGESWTTVDALFDQGRFNCISSVILFRCVGERFGLNIVGIEVPGHAYAVIESHAGSIVVQTTCADWFAVLADPEQRRAVLQRTLGHAASSADGGVRDGRRLNDAGLAAIVAYNRGLDHLEAGQFDAAIAANQTALALDRRNTAARTNLLATINNWSLARFRHGDYTDALRLLEQGVAAAPDYGLFYENLVAVHQQALTHRERTNSSPDAHRTALADCYRRWQSALRQSGLLTEADRVAGRAAADPFLHTGN